MDDRLREGKQWRDEEKGGRERECTMSLALERDGIRRSEWVRDEGEKGVGMLRQREQSEISISLTAACMHSSLRPAFYLHSISPTLVFCLCPFKCKPVGFQDFTLR